MPIPALEIEAQRAVSAAERQEERDGGPHALERAVRAAHAADDELGHPGAAQAHGEARRDLVRGRAARAGGVPLRGDRARHRDGAARAGQDGAAVRRHRGLPAAARAARAAHGALRHQGEARERDDHLGLAAGARPHRQALREPGRPHPHRVADLPRGAAGVERLPGRLPHGADRRRRARRREARGPAAGRAEVPLHPPELPEPGGRDPEPRAAAAPRRARQPLRGADRRGRPLRAAPLRGRAPAADRPDRRRAPRLREGGVRVHRRRALPLDAEQDARPGAAHRVGGGAGVGDLAPRADEAGRRPPHQHLLPDGGLRGGEGRVPRPPREDDPRGLRRAAERDAGARSSGTSRRRCAGRSRRAASSSGSRCPRASTPPSSSRRRSSRRRSPSCRGRPSSRGAAGSAPAA